MQNKTIFELYTDANKLKYSSDPKDKFSSLKINYEKLYTKETTSKVATTESLSKVPKRKKIPNQHFNHKMHKTGPR